MKTFLSSITALLIALGAGLLTAGLTGGDPALVVQALIHGAFGTEANIAGTLSKSVPLMLTGLSVAIAFRTGLFNIGGEGQLYAGALAAAWLGGLGLDLSPYLYLPIVILAGSIAGGIMGFIPGWLKARRGVHEVINTIMLNYIAIQTADFLVNGPLSSEVYSSRTKALASEATLPVLWRVPPSNLSMGILIAVVLCVGLGWMLFRTAAGFQIRATGLGPETSDLVGIPTKRVIIYTMSLAGGLSGLAGALEICGVHHTMYAQFSPGYGFDGIAVALLARNNPLAVIPAALLFGALRTADRWLQLSADVPRDLVIIIQAVTILAVARQQVLQRR